MALDIGPRVTMGLCEIAARNAARKLGFAADEANELARLWVDAARRSRTEHADAAFNEAVAYGRAVAFHRVPARVAA